MRLDAIAALGPDGAIRVVVESPRGSAVKLKYDRQLEVMMLSRPLPYGLTYPHDWGFVPGTSASDGDPVDALIVSDAATAPGVLVVCRPLGVLQVEQNCRSGTGRERNDRVIVVPESARRQSGLADVFALPERMRQELANFFVQATVFEPKDVRIVGWAGPDAAMSLIKASLVGHEQLHDAGGAG